jgi:hypothetical protein
MSYLVVVLVVLRCVVLCCVVVSSRFLLGVVPDRLVSSSPNNCLGLR